MTEQERADILARAVDQMIHRDRNQQPPQTRTDRELEGLVGIAESRARTGADLRKLAQQAHATVWNQVLARIECGPEAAVTTAPAEPEAAQVADIIAARRTLSDQILSQAGSQQGAVWREVASRLRTADMVPATEAGRPRTQARQAPDRIPPGHRTATSPLRPHIDREPTATHRQWGTANRRRGIAGVVAATTLFLAAIGPLPATGLADHPAAEAVQEVSSRLGVTETSTPPPSPTDETIVAAMDVSLEEAQKLTGLPAVAPQAVPEGFTVTSSRYFPSSLSADEGGLFVLTYSEAITGGVIDIFQETRSGASLAAPDGATVALVIAGRPATYIAGAWGTSSGSLKWETGGTQTVVFDAGDVRTTIRYMGGALSPQVLLDIVADLAAQSND